MDFFCSLKLYTIQGECLNNFVTSLVLFFVSQNKKLISLYCFCFQQSKTEGADCVSWPVFFKKNKRELAKTTLGNVFQY